MQKEQINYKQLNYKVMDKIIINVLEKNLDTYFIVSDGFTSIDEALEYANKYGYYVTVNGIFIN